MFLHFSSPSSNLSKMSVLWKFVSWYSIYYLEGAVRCRFYPHAVLRNYFFQFTRPFSRGKCTLYIQALITVQKDKVHTDVSTPTCATGKSQGASKWSCSLHKHIYPHPSTKAGPRRSISKVVKCVSCLY